MNKEMFLQRLADNLTRLSAEEREEVIRYYSEYFEEAGPENEAEVLEELGDPVALAKKLSAECETYGENSADGEDSTGNADSADSEEDERSDEHSGRSLEDLINATVQSALGSVEYLMQGIDLGAVIDNSIEMAMDAAFSEAGDAEDGDDGDDDYDEDDDDHWDEDDDNDDDHWDDEDWEEEIEDAQEEVEDAETEVQVAETDVADAQSEVEEAEGKVAEAREELEEATREVETAKQEFYAATREERGNARDKWDDAKERRQEAADALEEAKNELDDAKETLKEARDDLRDAQRELREAQRNLREVQRQARRAQRSADREGERRAYEAERKARETEKTIGEAMQEMKAAVKEANREASRAAREAATAAREAVRKKGAFTSLVDILGSNYTVTYRNMDLEPFENIDVDVINCPITVEQSQDGKYGVDVRLHIPEKDQANIGVMGGTLTVNTRALRRWNWIGGNLGKQHVRIYLPEKEYKQICLRTSNSTIVARCKAYAQDDLYFDSSNGAIKINGMQTHGQLKADTSNAAIVLEDVFGHEVIADTSNGAIHLAQISCEKCVADTSNGNISLRDCAVVDTLKADTSNGAIEAELQGGETDYSVSAHTSNSEVCVNGARCGKHYSRQGGSRKVALGTSNGRITINFT